MFYFHELSSTVCATCFCRRKKIHRILNNTGGLSLCDHDHIDNWYSHTNFIKKNEKKNTITTSFKLFILLQYSLCAHNILPTKKRWLSGKPNNFHKGLANSFVIILLTYQNFAQGRIQQKIKTLLIRLVHPFSSFPFFTPTRNTSLQNNVPNREYSAGSLCRTWYPLVFICRE